MVKLGGHPEKTHDSRVVDLNHSPFAVTRLTRVHLIVDCKDTAHHTGPVCDSHNGYH